MKRTINFGDFCDAFFNMGRKDQFSYNGKKALFEYIENLEQDTGDEMELDVIALCCEFTEYDNALDAGLIYNGLLNVESLTEDEKEKNALEFLRDNTLAITFDGGIIIQDF